MVEAGESNRSPELAKVAIQCHCFSFVGFCRSTAEFISWFIHGSITAPQGVQTRFW